MSNDNVYLPITKRFFKKYLEDGDGHNVFIPQDELPRKFRQAVELCVKHKGELFITSVEIITEELSPLAQIAVAEIARTHGYSAVCENRNYKMKYIGSDGGGHYSTDFYECLQYGRIIVGSVQ